MQEIAAQLRRIEDKLERLLGSGWRNAGDEARELASEADAVAVLGLESLAASLRKVAAADNAVAGLQSSALALAACRLLRVRLPVDEPPPGNWLPLGTIRTKKSPSPIQLLPVARMPLVGGEAWACVRLRGTMSGEYLLIEAVPSADLSEESTQPAAGAVARLLRFGRDGGESLEGGGKSRVNSPLWLARHLQGHLRWRERHLLGAAGEIQYCRLAEAEWLELPEAEHDPLRAFRKTLLEGKLKDGMTVFSGGGPLQLKELEGDAAENYVWPDPAAADAFMAIASGKVWALAWVQGALIAPLAVITPGGLLREPQLIHLVPGNPAETLAG